jgi:hypothetical protein
MQSFSGKDLRAKENPVNETVWQCEQWRAGQVLSRVVFNSKSEAEQFCSQMHKVEPDIFWRMQPVAGRMVWN